ncbi:MAG: sterol desaturase family protein [Planctomycetes bacterium]|nr:sterol desaturase family protein [Planctomycetota bacterium]
MVEILTWAGLLVVPAFLLLDLVVHPRRFDTPAFWRTRALLVSAGAVALSLKVGEGWAELLPAASLFDLSGLGTWWGAVVGILVYELVHYAYHRAAHTWTWLWRAGHQMHHSAEALDAFGANYLHPVDVLAFTSIAVLVTYPLLGLAPEAGALTSFFLAFNAMFQHANLRTPRWLGWVIQRPESHGVHHARGVHRWNYSDLPLWDLVFGTFRNPAKFEGAVGFYDGASSRLPEMLAGRDVSTPRAPSGAADSAPHRAPVTAA